jgi:hypothetical protein
MFDFVNKKKLEKKMAEWLAHPMEFGIAPQLVQYKTSFQVKLLGSGKTAMHLTDYVMPDGTRGRGIVEPVTWSFLGEQINEMSDQDMVIAYCGWLWLLPSL